MGDDREAARRVIGYGKYKRREHSVREGKCGNEKVREWRRRS